MYWFFRFSTNDIYKINITEKCVHYNDYYFNSVGWLDIIWIWISSFVQKSIYCSMIWILHGACQIACKLFIGVEESTVVIFVVRSMSTCHIQEVCNAFPWWLIGQMRNTKCSYTICISNGSMYSIYISKVGAL